MLDLLRQLVEGQRQIIALLERQHRPSSVLTRQDQDKLGKLLPVIAGLRGSELFLTSELVESSAPAVRLVCQGTARELGKLLRRAAGIPVGGYLVERVAREAGATLWRVLEVPEFRENGNLAVAHAPLPPRVE